MLSAVQLFATLWDVAYQAPLTMELSRQEHWREMPFPLPGDCPGPGSECTSLASFALSRGFFTTGATVIFLKWKTPLPENLRSFSLPSESGPRPLTLHCRTLSIPSLCLQSNLRCLWEGNRQEGKGFPNRGNRLHVSDILKSLPKVAGGSELSMEIFFLSYVNETMYLLWNLPFFKMVSPKTNFFLFSNLGLIIAQQTNIHINCFMAGGWHISCHPISKMHIVGEESGETLSALRCLSYLINNFLMNRKQLAKTSTGSFSTPLLVSVRSFLCPLSYFNKTLLHRRSWVIEPGPWSQS